MKIKYLPVFAAIAAAGALVGSGVASPAASEASRVPPQLAGQWEISAVSLAPPYELGTEYLTLADSRFMFFFNNPSGGFAYGEVSVSGNTITFYSSNVCTGTGTYQWSLSDGGLTFVQVAGSNDPCPREVDLTLGTWTRR
jgi:hypothetical protein